MTYIFYDQQFNIIPGASKVMHVQWLLADSRKPYSHESSISGIKEYYPYDRQEVRMDGLSNTGLNGYSNEYPYKYQGKEYQSSEWNGHQDGIELYDFDARFYEPALGRWFVPDPATARECVRTEQFHNPYLAMGNNPVVYVDPDGRIAFIGVVGIFAEVQLGSDMIKNDFKMNLGEIGTSLALGAVQGALAASGAGGLASYTGNNSGLLTLGSAVAGQINVPVHESENFSLSLSPTLLTGTNGVRLGAIVIAGVRTGKASFSMGYSIGRNFSVSDLSGTMVEAKWSSNISSTLAWSGNGWGISMGNTSFGGNFPQTVANYGFSIGKFSASIENDFGPAGDGGDRWRSAALKMSYRVNNDLAITGGFSLWTGEATDQSNYYINGRSRPCYYCEDERPSSIRNGNAFIGADYRGLSYAAGINSESVRAPLQNGWHNAMGSPALKWIFGNASPHFERMPYPGRFYSSFGTYNPFSVY